MTYEHKTTQTRQKEIISAARKLIVRLGSEHVTVRRVAHEIGVSEGAIYRHFKSKRDVLSFLVDDIEQTLIGDIEKNSESGLGALDTLERVVKSHISSIEQRKGISFQVIAEIISFGDKKLNKKAFDVINRYVELVQNILLNGVKEGTVRPDLDLDAAAKLFFGMTQGLVNTWALSNYSFKVEEKYEKIWLIYREAITSR